MPDTIIRCPSSVHDGGVGYGVGSGGVGEVIFLHVLDIIGLPSHSKPKPGQHKGGPTGLQYSPSLAHVGEEDSSVA